MEKKAQIATTVRGYDDEELVETYMWSWHHLEAYMTKLQVKRKYLRSLGREATFTERAERNFTVKRSRKFDLKSGTERIEFFAGVLAILCYRMRMYSGGNQVFKKMVAGDFSGSAGSLGRSDPIANPQ